MKLLIKQEYAVYYLKDDVTTEVVYGGAAGGGKSALGCLWLIENCQKYAGSRWLMGRSKLKALRETTLNTFYEIATEMGISDQFTVNNKDNVINWNNGSQILMKDLFLYPSDPNFDSLGSLEICGAFIDECNQVDEKAWTVVKSRIRYKLAKFGIIPKMLGSCNPAKNWVYKKFYKAKKDGTIEDFRKFVQALPEDNPHLPPSYIESLLQMDNTSKQRLYYGNWEYDDDPSILMHIDAINDYFDCKNHLEPDTSKRYMTVDVARLGSDKTIIRVWHGWVCVARFVLKVARTTETANKVKEIMAKYGVPPSHVVVDEDGVGGGVVDMVRCKGFVNNSKALDGENYENLRSQCYHKMALKINSREAGEVGSSSDTVKTTTEEMEQIRQKNIDKDGKIGIIAKEDIKKHLRRSPDDWDSIGMRYYFEYNAPPKVRHVKLID